MIESAEDSGQEARKVNLSGKTPVSFLQELYVRKGITPKYDLVQIEGAVHEPTFKYRVAVGDVLATGSGQSKKKAKHSAAKAVLDKLCSAGEIRPDIIASLRTGEFGQNCRDYGDYDDGIPGNPVGELQELCMNRRMQPPTYEVSREEGQPHERSFVLVCIVGSKYRESGNGKSKKLAKRQAAYKMLTKLKKIPAEHDDGSGGCNQGFHSLDEDELAQGIAHRNTTLKEISRNNYKFYSHIRPILGSKLSIIQSECLEEDYYSFAIKNLEQISKEQDFSVTYVDIEERALNGEYHCLVQLSTNPVAVCYGIGISDKDAKLNAAFHACEYLRILTK
ncbi:TARBP2 [Lepeophtheirus salmonis]|uniref:Interferon-inducible double stranded RNA-dependent protein kinase activator A homolog n=1 Tax=Lepeophtheirus salmonis TaxID=72036 RepID=C1BVU7_LEPSM|nr:LOW QUALITY PROTEIN: RISC-loading complex subunit tarbp2-like [Lepeophtheirus salmonis]ACO13150.1 Interferon-inducible double stranded RNA-dependent protein kinase activator A homolog [Lepeophtheirus salmonis]CAB4069450.1 TARBP2 [Lepeophtheirus salmonis]CAF3027547.1 TARBP2 [Lepeophtheirus salmonis]